MENINNKLRQLRKERGLTLSDLAEKMGTDHQHISRIERGKSKLTVDFLLKLANALETPLEGIMENSLKKESVDQKKEELLNAPTNSRPHVNLLASILEKIETIVFTHQLSLSNREKAFLASEIYSQSLKASSHNDPEKIQQVFIECAITMLESIYEK